MGCTLAGIGHEQLVDGHSTAQALHEHFLDNKLYSNLPRKYKISITGCAEDCARGLINDLALSGAIHDDGTRGFNIRVGGGLSTAPRLARWIDVFVTPEEAPEVCEHITAIFRDSEENRKARGKARFKFVLDRMGPDGFRDELERRVGRELRRGARNAPDLRGHDHIGVSPQNDGEHSTVGFCVPGRAPEGLAAAGVRPPRPRVRADAGGPADPPAERPAAVDPERPRRRAARRAARPGARAAADVLQPRAAVVHGQGVLRPGQGPHEGAERAARPRSPRSSTST